MGWLQNICIIQVCVYRRTACRERPADRLCGKYGAVNRTASAFPGRAQWSCSQSGQLYVIHEIQYIGDEGGQSGILFRFVFYSCDGPKSWLPWTLAVAYNPGMCLWTPPLIQSEWIWGGHSSGFFKYRRNSRVIGEKHERRMECKSRPGF